MPTYTTTFQKSFFALFGLLALNVYGHGESEERVWPRNSKLAPAKRLVPVIESRATFYGGWSLAMAPCPSGLDDHNGACCPKGTFIYSVKMGGLPKGSACCPDEKISCGDAVAAIPICADTSWYLWVNSGQNPFCCLQGEIGYETPGGIWGAGSLCAASDVPVPSSILASSMALSTATTAKKTSTGTAASASSTSGGQTNTNSNDNSVSINSDSSSSSSSAASSNSNSSTSTDTTNKSLSTTAIVVIAVGVVIVVTAISLVVFLVKRRKNTQKIGTAAIPEAKPADPPEYANNVPVYHEVQTKPAQGYHPSIPEADGTSGYGNELAG